MKASGYLFSFKKLNKKGNIGAKNFNAGDSKGEITRDHDISKPTSLRWRFKNLSSGLRWNKKSLYKLHHWFVDSFLFKIVSVFEAIALVSTLAFFFFCCGCHI
uniref:Avr9/Cf-9 rapidly elicited protein 180 n=1 Tax=Nicotiana tabacum TaxID=4097 RepID=Q9FQZ1_TOBAC|nr:Avr9/Cf-9 rapidly elicited protein 180 [Nicotiana tabacum]